jgi:hypothetical protein
VIPSLIVEFWASATARNNKFLQACLLMGRLGRGVIFTILLTGTLTTSSPGLGGITNTREPIHWRTLTLSRLRGASWVVLSGNDSVLDFGRIVLESRFLVLLLVVVAFLWIDHGGCGRGHDVIAVERQDN